MPLCFEKPLGTRDILPEKLQKLNFLNENAKQLIKKWGYEEIDTPMVEYYQTVGLYSKIDDDKLIKFLDITGKTVILRPDFTTPIARMVSSVYKDVELPIRLMYQGYVFRNKGNHGIETINQLGIELIGIKTLEADAEVISLAVKTLLECTKSEFKVSIGHTGFLKILFDGIGCSPQTQEQLFKSLAVHDYVSFKNTVNSLEISDKYRDYLTRIVKLKGNLGEVLEAQQWFSNQEWQNIFSEISQLWTILCQYNLEEYVSFDLSRVGRQNYYTGLIYNIFCAGYPYPICSGGRYDQLLSSFGRTAPATGFAVNIDDLLNVINKEERINTAPSKVLILFTAANRLQAIKEAEKLREQNKIVVLAEENSVSDNYQKSFREIIKYK